MSLGSIRSGTALTAAIALALALVALPMPSEAADGGEPAGAGAVVVAYVVEDEAGRPAVRRVRAPDRIAAGELVAELEARPDVVAAAPARRVEALGHADGTDPRRGRQWHLDRLFGRDRVASAHASGQVVAIVDTGVDARHPDLAGVVLRGVDLVGGSKDGRSDPDGHGTTVAGVVAAVTGNDVGVAGVAPGARILPVRVLDASGTGTSDDVADGIMWAVDHGATVVNLSLGLEAVDEDEVVAFAVGYAVRNGIPVVAAAGNGGDADPVWPAASAGSIAVTSTGRADDHPDFASYGSWLDLAAPGVDIYTTFVPRAYGYETGTSVSAPIVTGVVALLRAARPGLAPHQVAARLRYNAIDIGRAGRDALFGSGLVAPNRTLAPAPRFRDIAGTTHESSIRAVAETRITVGCRDKTVYCPGAAVTRGEMATFLMRALQLAPSSKRRFTDTAGTSHEPAINAIAAAGITRGCGETAYCPNRRVTRAEMATFLLRALDLAPARSTPFRDVPDDSSHVPGIGAIARAGITRSCNSASGGDRYCPDRRVTRGEMATFLTRGFRL